MAPIQISDLDEETLAEYSLISLLEKDPKKEPFEVLLQAIWDCLTQENTEPLTVKNTTLFMLSIFGFNQEENELGLNQ